MSPGQRYHYLRKLAVYLERVQNQQQAKQITDWIESRLSYAHQQLYDILGDYLAGKDYDAMDFAMSYGNMQGLERTLKRFLELYEIGDRPSPPVLSPWGLGREKFGGE